MALYNKTFAAAAIGIAALGLAPANDYSPVTAAYAQEVPTLANLDKCVSPQEIVQRADNEGQYLAVNADMEGAFRGQRRSLRNIFSTDEKFTKGYRIAASTNFDGTFCKIESYNEPRILDARGAEIDKRTLIPSDLIGIKGSLANSIEAGSKAGEKPVFQYVGRLNQSGEVSRVTISGKINGDGALLVADKSGMVQDLRPFINVKYTPEGEKLLASSKSRALASLSLNVN